MLRENINKERRAIVELIPIDDNTYEVLSDSGNVYTIKVNMTGARCTCLGFKHRHSCKHIKLIEIPEKKRYPRICADEVLAGLEPALCNTQYTNYTIAGSYRRQKEMIGDVDILIQMGVQSFLQLHDKLKWNPAITFTCTGTEIIRGAVPTSYGNIQFDITRINEDEYPFYLLYRTGPKERNIQMRSLAKMIGYKLNEHGLTDEMGIKVECHTEEDIFFALGMKYIEPQDR